MSLAPGTRLGAYEVLALLGAGGMGEVYRARDTRLARDVAVKVLPEDFLEGEESKARFEREARLLAALNHPGIAAIHSFEEIPGPAPSSSRHLLVMELVEGESLEKRATSGPLSLEESLSCGRQIAEALEAAHERGIVHRDLKPANVMVSSEGRVKLLDFGLAKAFESDPSSPNISHSPTLTARGTAAGMILGTAAYMSPEQARGKPVDKRSDIWAFGVVLYEMLTGARLFRGETVSDTLASVLREPVDFKRLPASTPHNVRSLLERCLERDPKERLRDIGEARIALEHPSTPGGVTAAGIDAPRSSIGRWLPWAIAVLAIGALCTNLAMTRRTASPVQPTFTRLTFRQGYVTNARFAPDGQAIIYDATWEGGPYRVFSMRKGGQESTIASEPDTRLLDVSSKGELALLLKAKFVGTARWVGTLARAPLGSGAPREILTNALEAAWQPDGSNLAAIRVLRDAWTGSRLDSPPGKTLLESAGRMARLRISPDGKLIAFIDHQSMHEAGAIAVLDANGKKKNLTSEWGNLAGGLAWSPRGDEIWFTGSRASRDQSLWAVDLTGRERCVATLGGSWTLHDISSEGRVIMSTGRSRLVMIGATPTGERDLSWFDWSYGRDISSDGQLILFEESGEAVATQYVSFIRRQDGSPALRLGEGHAVALSPDGKWALLYRSQPQESLVLVPTGAGEERILPRGTIAEYDLKTLLYDAAFFPDNRRVVFRAAESGKPKRLFFQDTEGGLPIAFGEDDLLNPVVSPDGKRIAVVTHDETALLVFSADGKLEQNVKLAEASGVIAWCKDNRSVYLKTPVGLTARIDRLELPGGRREVLREIVPQNPAGIVRPAIVNITPDGRSWVSTYPQFLNDLYLVEGLK